MTVEARRTDSLIIHYLTLRKIIGILGLILPLTMALGGFIFHGTGLQNSISDYYHVGMSDLFVGILCVIGFFLYAYRGYDRIDNIIANIAGFSALGIAFFPSTPPAETIPNFNPLLNIIHIISAATFFLSIIYFSLFLFTKTGDQINLSAEKKQRIYIYKVCGWIMIIDLILITICNILLEKQLTIINDFNLIFWLESILVATFGVSWLIKGKTIRGQ